MKSAYTSWLKIVLTVLSSNHPFRRKNYLQRPLWTKGVFVSDPSFPYPTPYFRTVNVFLTTLTCNNTIDLIRSVFLCLQRNRVSIHFDFLKLRYLHFLSYHQRFTTLPYPPSLVLLANRIPMFLCLSIFLIQDHELSGNPVDVNFYYTTYKVLSTSSSQSYYGCVYLLLSKSTTYRVNVTYTINVLHRYILLWCMSSIYTYNI